VSGSAMLGMDDQYTVTVLIAGEEEWWGEKCFWLETWTDHGGKFPDRTASLISYAIFDDSLADERLQMYRRKLISGVEEGGKPALYIHVANTRASGVTVPDAISKIAKKI